MLKVKVIVPKGEGFVEQVKGYEFARQVVQVFEHEGEVPHRVTIEIYTPKGGKPEWKEPGAYEAPLTPRAGQYGKGLSFDVNFRAMTRLQQAAPAVSAVR